MAPKKLPSQANGRLEIHTGDTQWKGNSLVIDGILHTKIHRPLEHMTCSTEGDVRTVATYSPTTTHPSNDTVGNRSATTPLDPPPLPYFTFDVEFV